MTRPLSDTLNELIVLAEDVVTRPHALFDERVRNRIGHLAQDVRRADAQPAEGERTTYAAMITIVAMEAAVAGKSHGPWARMIIGAALEPLRTASFRQLDIQREARG